MRVRAIAYHLIAWERRNGRRPPWRQTSDPYKFAAAEILLQKTREPAVAPVWSELVGRFPSPSSLLLASDSEVRAIVGPLGLGNQRTQRLKAMAAALRSPTTAMKIPGLGSYGSSVVALATGKTPVNPPVDGNIARVVTRLEGLKFDTGEPRKKQEVRKTVAQLLDSCGTPKRRLEAVYGLVDLGARICTPLHPRHAECPLFEYCASRNL